MALAALSLSLVAGASLGRGDATGPSSAEPPTIVQGSQPPRLLRVWVHGDGIYPEFLRLPPGRVVIRSENETQSDINLVVERVIPGQSNQSLARVPTPVSQKRANHELALAVGEYVYYEESQPQYKGLLTVGLPGSQ